MASYILSIVGLTKYRLIKIISKIIIGIGTSFILYSIWTLDYPFWVILVVTSFIFYVTMMPVNVKRLYEIKKTCEKCRKESPDLECKEWMH